MFTWKTFLIIFIRCVWKCEWVNVCVCVNGGGDAQNLMCLMWGLLRIFVRSSITRIERRMMKFNYYWILTLGGGWSEGMDGSGRMRAKGQVIRMSFDIRKLWSVTYRVVAFGFPGAHRALNLLRLWLWRNFKWLIWNWAAL